MIRGSLSNIVLDYLFIFPLHMGIFGAILATGLAPVISISVLSPYFIRKKNRFHFMKSAPDIKKGIGVITVISLVVVAIYTGLSRD